MTQQRGCHRPRGHDVSLRRERPKEQNAQAEHDDQVYRLAYDSNRRVSREPRFNAGVGSVMVGWASPVGWVSEAQPTGDKVLRFGWVALAYPPSTKIGQCQIALNPRNRQAPTGRPPGRSRRCRPASYASCPLCFKKFAFSGDVAAVALGGDVLAQGRDGFAGDHPAADGGLDGDLELVAVDLAFELSNRAPPVGVGAMHDYGEGVSAGRPPGCPDGTGLRRGSR